MRILIDVGDDAMDEVLSTKPKDGRFVFWTLDGHMVEAKVVGRAIPEHIAGTGHTYKALYTIIMLEDMDGTWTDCDSATGKLPFCHDTPGMTA